VNGKAFKPSDWGSSGAPIIRIQNLNGVEKPFNYWGGALDRQVKVQSGDVLLAWSGTPGTSFGVHIWDRGFGILNQHIFRVDLDQTKVTPRWFMHAVNGQLSKLIAKAHGGVGLQHVTRPMVDSLEIPLPPLDEQRRIAAILDKADALRRKRKRAIDLLDSLTQSIFLQMFEDVAELEFKPLANLIDQRDRINYGVVQPGDEVANGIHLVRVSDLKNGIVDHSRLRKVSQAISDKHHRSVLRGNEILISCVGSIGEVAVVSPRERGFNIARAVARVPIVDDLQRSFVVEYLRSPIVQRYFTRELRTVSQPTLNIKQISETLIPMPPRSRLQEFLERSGSARDVLSTTQAHLAGSELLFSSLQSRAFSGQL
jgi:type I restriction enzyme S subunit